MSLIYNTSMIGALLVAFVLILQGGSCGKPQQSNSPHPTVTPKTVATPVDERSPTAARGKALRNGIWGGEHVALTVTATGAEIEFDCAHGEISRPIALDAEGHFEAAGTFVREGGPISVPANGNLSEKPISAHYRGRVEGEAMNLTVTLASGNTLIGEFTLAKGKPPFLTKCY